MILSTVEKMSRVCCQLSPCSAEALREKVSFHSSPQLPDVLLKTFCFLIGPQGAAPTLLLTRKPITVDLTCPLSLLVYRCVSGASLGTDQ